MGVVTTEMVSMAMDTTTTNLFDALLNRFPTWGFILLLLLAFLMAHPGTAYSREELLEKVWGWSFGDQSTVTVHVRRLREKVEPDPTRPTRLATVWGVGYRWDPVMVDQR